jgi:hypothetical protein
MAHETAQCALISTGAIAAAAYSFGRFSGGQTRLSGFRPKTKTVSFNGFGNRLT